MVNLATKYRPNTWEDVIGQKYIIESLKNQVDKGEFEQVYLFSGSAGVGKAQPLYSNILTKNGYKSMRDIQIGDEIFTDSGNLSKVIGVYPQGKRDIYEISLQDKTKIRVSDNHLNKVYWYNQYKKEKEYFILETNELIKRIESGTKYKLRIDMPSVDWEYQDVLIDPYLLGLLITDGSFSKGNFGITNSEQDILLNVNKILKENYNMYLRHSSKYDYRIQYIDNPNHCGSRGDRGRHSLIRNYNYTDTLKGQLDFYGLLTKSVNKHIPKEYLLNNKDMRIKLLQGLFDGDGTIEKNGSPVFSTSSKQLSDDFAFLVRSLGIRDTITEKESFFNGKQHSNNYSHYLHVPNNLRFYNSKKHEGRAKERQNGQIRNIVGIEYIGKEECQCIMVDHVDHTYISDDFIPTHNTTIARIMAREIKGQVLEIDAASNNGVDDVRNIIIDAKSKPFAHDYKVYIIDEVHMLSNAAFNAMLKILEEPPSYVIFIMCTTEPNKIIPTVRSRSQHFNFKRVDKELIKGRLETMNPNLEENVYDYIAELSEGGVRDAITLLDTCMQYKSIFSIDDAQNILGIVNDEIIEELLINIYDDKNRTLKIINDVYIVGTDMKKFLRDILNFIVRRQKKEVLEGIESYDSINLDVIFEEVYKLYNEIKYEDNPKILIEGVFLCMDRKE